MVRVETLFLLCIKLLISKVEKVGLIARVKRIQIERDRLEIVFQIVFETVSCGEDEFFKFKILLQIR
jgi:hypothetical protein